VAHWPSPAQVFPQIAASQAKPPHGCVAMFGHLPVPAQFAANVATPFVRLAARHVVEAVGYVHVLVLTPSQVPAHVVPSVVQRLRPPTGAPVTGEHVPTLLGSLQDSHCPKQPELQQTPSAQKPLSQSEGAVHASPMRPTLKNSTLPVSECVNITRPSCIRVPIKTS